VVAVSLVVLAVTQPDKPKGRGNAMQFPPVKEYALAHGIEVFQPKKIREEENVAYLRKFAADIIVVVAFGQILTKNILDMPKYGCINVHASLLPKYRGAAPIQWAVLNGDAITGVTTMRMDAGIDTGDMIAKREVRIAEDETGGSLFDKLAGVGAALCVETMEQLENGTAVFTPQNEAESTHVGMIRKEMGDIDWERPAVEIERLIRGLNPWPSAYTHLDDKTFKIWSAKVVPGDDTKQPGQVIRVGKNELLVQTGDGALSLLTVQLAGKKRMDAGSFLRGYPVEEGRVLQ
jgi:methionyl-tRNA formyltransferase